ncbi:MAG: ABC transporter ATP-binding protein/permease [Bacteroidetes bacterium]|nr:ABC transporter ATP-binding protein/permease [Bacteroidota bacterium]
MNLLFQYLKPHRSLLAGALLLATVSQVFSMLDPWVGRNILDKYLIPKNSHSAEEFLWGMIGWLSIGVGVAMVSRIAKNLQDYLVNVVIQKAGARIFMEGIKHTLDLPYEDYEDRRSGETLNILQKVRSDSEKLISLAINLLYSSAVGVLFVFFASLSVHWLIAPAFLFAMLVVGVSSSMLSKRIKLIQGKIMRETSALAGTTTESLRNIELVKSLGLIAQEIRRISTNTLKILGLELEKVKKVRTLGFIQGTTVNFMRNCLLLFLSWMVFTDRISAGMYLQFLFYTFFIFNPLQELGTFIQAWREAQVSLNRFADLMEAPSEPKPENPERIGAIQQIRFEQVTYRHRHASRPALQDINLEIKQGETIAFVGPSGSGKSTLVKLLIGLYKPVAGNLYLNEIEASKTDRMELRSQLGLVAQEAQLFSGTIRDNLLFVQPQAEDSALMHALHLAAADGLLARAEKGLDATIGEGGMKVSGGEKQRISIARALLRHPSLMIFDEATSALDSLTEREITGTVKALSMKRDRINILIAHRLSTIMHADRIYVLEQGRIIETGTHDELCDLRGLYYAMWRQQIGEGNTEESGPQA